MLTCISSVVSFWSESDKASTDPSTSPFKIIFNSLKSPTFKRRPISSRVIFFCERTLCSRCNCKRFAAICLASRSSSITMNLSPEVGAPSIPSRFTGVEGPATLIRLPLSSNIAFTLPEYCPART